MVRPKTRVNASSKDAHDVIVVGAGPAGCVVARRLADGGRRVTVIEAGPGEPRPTTVLGVDGIAAAEDSDWLWPDVLAQPGPGTEWRSYRQGRGIGGGSAINAMLMAPGDREDYDRWANEGCEGWSAADMEPWLAKALAATPTTEVPPGPITAAFAAAAAGAGHAVGGSSLEQGRFGVLTAALSADGLDRRSAYDNYLLGAEGVEVRPSAMVDHILTSGRRATGVVLADGATLAANQIIVSGGAIQSPLLLARSGLGSEAAGQGLRDHPSFTFTMQLREEYASAARSASPSTIPPRNRGVSQLLRWSSDSSSVGDLQAFVIDRVDDGERSGMPLAVVIVGLMDVTSIGRVQAAEDGRGAKVTTGALQTEQDRKRLRTGVRHVRRLLAAPELTAMASNVFIDDRGTPIGELDRMTDDRLDDWLRDHPGPYAHPSGTCALGPEGQERSVVSHHPHDGGRLLGCEGVHVIDASIMPVPVKAGLQLPVTAVAERLADGLLLQEP